MEQTCPNCGATNRGTSRFCARCGQLLPQVEGDQPRKSEGSLDLPWLQAVQDKAVQNTSSLGPSLQKRPRPQTPARHNPLNKRNNRARKMLPAASQPPQAAQQPTAEQVPPGQPGAGENKGEPPPPWVVGILEASAAPAPPAGPEQTYEPEELSAYYALGPWPGGRRERSRRLSPPARATPLVRRRHRAGDPQHPHAHRPEGYRACRSGPGGHRAFRAAGRRDP